LFTYAENQSRLAANDDDLQMFYSAKDRAVYLTDAVTNHVWTYL